VHGLALETKLAAANNDAATKAQVIRQTFGLDKVVPVKRATLIKVLQDRLKAAGLASGDAEVADLKKIAETLNRELGGEASSKKLASLGAAKHQAQQLTSALLLLLLYNQVVAAADELVQALKSSAEKAPVQLLVDALGHIKATSADSCPVCEQEIDRVALMDRLAQRIKEDEAVQLAGRTLEQRIEALRTAFIPVRQAYAAFTTGWQQLDLSPLPPCYVAAGRLFAHLDAITAKTAGENKNEIEAAFAAAECDPRAQIVRMDEEIVSVGGGERRTRLEQVVSLINSLQGDVAKYEALHQGTAILEKQKAAIDKLHAHAEASRKAAVQTIANDVAALANAFYEEIHPGEGIATSKLVVREAVAGSMLLSSTFHGREAQPLLYYSDAHLDTLGLCYFLAIRKLEVSSNPNFKLLLVDDVLHSVDAEHRARLARLIRDKFGDHQLVLVTHDKYFYDRLREILGGGYKYIAISDWDIQSGPRISDPSTDLDVVIDLLARKGKSHTDIAAAGGRFFDWLLKQLTERLEVAIHARFSRGHDIGSMWPPCAKKLEQHIGFAKAHPELVKKLTENAWVRNKVGAHHEETESSVTPGEVTGFVDQLASLYSATHCDGCGSFIQKSKTEAWRCDCSKLQYDP
jgi:hypothetical protein